MGWSMATRTFSIIGDRVAGVGIYATSVQYLGFHSITFASNASFMSFHVIVLQL